MMRLLLTTVAALLLFACSKNRVTDSGPDGLSATIYEQNGRDPAAGAVITVFEAAAVIDSPVSVYIADSRGRFSIDNLPDGIYTVFAEKDSFVLMQDSVAVIATQGTLKDDTLEPPSSLTGIAGVESLDDPNTVSIRLAGTGKTYDVLDKEGWFTLRGLASGRAVLVLTCRLPGYLPTVKEITIAPGTHDTLVDTLRLSYSGIPVVSGIRISQDIFAGTVVISWNKASCKDFKDYAIYRDSCKAIDLLPEPTFATKDTFVIDSLYCGLFATQSDTLPRCLKYRVAVRTIAQTIGLTNGYAAMRFMPKVFVTTFFTHDIRYEGRRFDSVSIDDTVVYSIIAKNRTRPLRKVFWWDPVKEIVIADRKTSDSIDTELHDSIRYAFHDTGNHLLWAVVTDSAGTMWPHGMIVRTVIDTLVAQAGNDTGVFIGENIHLHGAAKHLFGTIPFWRWKIGGNDWIQTSGPDTIFKAPSAETTFMCNLWITDEDGTSRSDTMCVTPSLKATGIAAGGQHSLILKSDGALWTVGKNGNGQLCDSSIVDDSIPGRRMTGVQTIAAGYRHTLALMKSGDLWVCGDNGNGQFGDGTTEGRLTPKRIMTGVRSIAANGFLSLVLKVDSSLWVCGWNQSIQTEGALSVNRYMPMLVMTGVRDMAAGYSHLLILKTDTTLWACGENDFGQLGDSSWLPRSLPVLVMDRVQSVAAGDKFSLIVTTDGTLWACGKNDNGQLGDGTTIMRSAPVMVTSDVRSVAAGFSHSLILKTDGTVWTCGNNEKGQLGDGTLIDKYSPTWIMKDVQSISAGGQHSLILKTDGTVWACGDDASGQLGNGTRTDRPAPARMIPYHYYPK